jgi:plastocyanin
MWEAIPLHAVPSMRVYARRRRVLGLGLVVFVPLITACGGGGSGSSAPCPTTGSPRAAVNGAVTVCAYDIRFDVKEITAAAGPLEITLINKGSQAHTFEIDGANFELKTPSRNATASGSVTLAAGKTYVYKCTTSGHDAAGMHGKIVVS